MYLMARKHAGKIFVFSTRRSAFTVTPDVSWCSFHTSVASIRNLPTIAILEHRDSYLGKTTYYALNQGDDCVISEPASVENQDNEQFFATKIQNKNQRRCVERFVFTAEEKKSVNESIYDLFMQETK